MTSVLGSFLFVDMELLFKVVEVAPSGDRVIAAADNLAVARAAYDTAVAFWLATVIVSTITHIHGASATSFDGWC